jgi:hypothetical protein
MWSTGTAMETLSPGLFRATMARRKNPSLEFTVGELIQPWHLIVIFFFLLPIFMLVTVLPYWMIFKKAGFSPALSLLMIVPGVNFVVLFVVAFTDWKVVPAPTAYYPPQMQPPPQA